MAGLLATYLQDLRVMYPNALDVQEWRTIRYGLVNSAIEQNASPMSIITPDMREKAMASQGRVLNVPVFKKGALTISNVRSCNLPVYENETALVNVTWATLQTGFSMVTAQYNKNEVSYLNDLQKKLILLKESILAAIESSINTKLDAEKSTVFNSTIATSKYTPVGDALQVLAVDQPLFFNDVDAIQEADDIYSESYVLASTNLNPSVTKYINQGSGNSTNLTFQFAGKTYRFSNNVTNGAGVLATGYIMPVGSLGMLTRVDIDAKMNNKSSDGTEWGTVNIPGIPFEIGYQYKSTCSDQNALNGTGQEHLTATLIEKWSFSVDFALLTPYNSDPATIAGVIKKFEFLV